MRRTPLWFYISALVCAALSLYSISLRHRAEMRNRAVMIAAEFETLQSMALAEGIPLEDAAAQLKQKGLGALVLSEETVGNLVTEGFADVRNGEIRATDESYVQRINRGQLNRFPQSGTPASSHVPAWLLRGTSVGLDPEEATLAKTAGLKIIGRLSNVPGATDEYVQKTLTWAKELGMEYFLPQGDQVLGRRDSLKATVDTLNALGIAYATPEFAKIGGDANVVGMAPENVIRLHSAQTAELDKLTMADAVERYSKAARERNMRILLVRPVSLGGEKPLQIFGDFIEKIGKDVQSQAGPFGLQLGDAHPLEDSGVPAWLVTLIALSAVPAGIYVLSMLFGKASFIWAGAAILLLLALYSYVSDRGAQIAALAASILFPIAAMLTLDTRTLRHPAVEFLITTGISLVGGLAVAGMLNGLPYFVKAEAFPGVKISVFVPIAVVGGYYFIRLAKAREAMSSPITWGASLLGIVLIAALGYLMARTGNESPTGVSSFELQFRNILDAILVVRPRTKEFLIGHPALVVAIGMLAYFRQSTKDNQQSTRLGGWTALMLAGGVVGQTSIVNTLCHLHTPVILSLWRIANGVILGLILGVVVWAIVGRVFRKELAG